jgi:UDPglucose--hexose-1-phosphate uridylyltransferase
MYCERSRALSEDERLAYVLIFKNVGQSAGASLEHSHSQLVAVPVMPKRVQEEMHSCQAFYEESSDCLFCSILAKELEGGERVVLEDEHFAVLTPFASRFPFEMWVLPKEHQSHLFQLDGADISGAARALQQALARLEICLRDPPYNYAIHTAPATGEGAAYYHWHIELMPRVTHVAGFEWGTGFYINPMAPESAARYLREVPWEEVCGKIGGARAERTCGT